MIFHGINYKRSEIPPGKLVAVLLFLLGSFIFVPAAEAACPDPAFAAQGELIELIACTEGRSTANNVQVVTLPVPAGVPSGDLLVTVLTTDGSSETFDIITGWTKIGADKTGQGITSNVYLRRSDGAEPASYDFTWGSGEHAYAYMMQFTNASGLFVVGENDGNDATPQPSAPSISSLSDENLILRILAVDRRPIAIDPSPIVTSHIDITQDRSANSNSGTAGGGAYTYLATAGLTGAASFTLTGSGDGWHTRTMAIEPIEFRFSMTDTTASVCGVQLVTLSVTDRLGNPMTWFTGEVTLSASNSINAVWSDGPGLTNSIADGGGGNALYQFAAGDNGVAVFEYYNPDAGSVVNFDLSWFVFTENPAYDPTLTIDDLCEFRISYDDGSMGTCSSEDITIGVYDSDGELATRYSGTIDISNDQTDGDYTADVSATNAVVDVTGADDGAASYTFDESGDAGQVILNFTDSTGATVDFDIVDVANPTFLVTVDPTLEVADCEIVLSHSTESDVCSLEAITISINEPSGGPVVTDFTGTITLTNDALAGDWTVNDATNLLVDTTPGDGEVEYTFDLADAGDIILDFELNQTNAAIDFDATTTTPGFASPSGAGDLTLEIVACTATIDVNATTNVCSVSETITLSIFDRDGGVPNGTIGTVVISTSESSGDYISTTGFGTLDNGAVDDGIATYEFDALAGDTNAVDIEFATSTVETLDFIAASTFITFDALGSSENLEILACEFRISHSTASDVCSIETVTIEVFNSAGGAVTDYVGTVNFSTSTGNGTWTNSTGVNPSGVVDPFAEDGNASYEFLSGDNGEFQLFFTDATAETVNINVSDGVTTDSNPSFDPNLTVAVCTFRIVMDDATMSACSTEDVTITVYDSLNAIASNYTGTVTITTDTLNGNWVVLTGTPANLTETPGDDDGFATYEFDVLDGGTVTLTFIDPNVETVNVDLIDGVIIEDAAFDPDLVVTGCIPDSVNSVCFDGNGGSNGTGNLVISAADPGRMVVMVIFHIGTQDVTSATFGGVGMTQIHEITGSNSAVEMWGILDTDIPGGAGSYAGDYSFGAAPANDASMCMVELADVEQAFPAIDFGTPTQGQVNANFFVPDGAPLDLSTSITTSANNAFVLSVGVSDFTQAPNSWFNDVEPQPPMSQFFFDNNDQNPENGTAGGSTGSKSVAGLITVNDIDNQDAVSSAAHIVASFDPLVAGSPEAVDYEPVLLFETLSGNISYRAIGATLRTASNTNGGACSFVPVGTGAEATLTLPAGSTVVRAIVYWSGSGEQFEADADVDFGLTGFESSITADDVFFIDNIGNGTLDYFAGYKDVTSLVALGGSGDYTLKNLTVQFDAPWSGPSACAGGWALIVVYSNTAERFRVANLFHGFQPFHNSNFTLVPRNFRMQTTDNPLDVPGAGFVPNGQITHITVEGDETLATGDESLAIQDGPGLETFTNLSNSFNPPTADFNSTVSRPIFAIDGGTGFYEFQSTAGVNSDGFEIDNDPGFIPAIPEELGDSWGFDVDTHFIAGNDSSGVLWNFAQAGFEAEEITTRYSTGQDLVLLISEVITVTNFDLADLEIFKSQSGDFKVDGTGSYQFTVTNNGNGGISGGEATGQVLVADILPTGLTLDSVAGTDWTCGFTTVNAFLCIYDIADCDVIDGCSIPGELSTGESLPLLTANILVGDTSFFPLLSNNVKNVVRMLANDGSCVGLTAGVVPLADDCDRSPQYDNVNDLQGGAIDINDLDDKTAGQNNVDSIITEVRGVETDLGITKVVDGILEQGEEATYTITVTNFGPDDTTGTPGGIITVTDVEPAGVTFLSASGTGWTCSPVPPVDCTYDGVLMVGNSAIITLTVDVTGIAPANVTNTAVVASGTYNFDTNSGNDADTDITAIVAPPVSSNEKFLISVSVDGTQIGGLAAFENDDFIIYDPLIDVGTLFYDDSAEGFNVDDADAVHLFKNGHLALSAANASSTVGSNSLAFEPEDIVVWDPVLGTATMLFDGSAIFDGPITSDHNIDAVYVKGDSATGTIVFSTAGPAAITFAMTTVNFNQGDIVEYDPSDGSATILIDASDPEIFAGEVQVDGIYIRVDDIDPDLTKEIYVLSVNESAIVGACGSCDPIGGTALTRDDIVELDLTGANPVTENLFIGNQPLGVFEPTDNNRALDAIHVVEDIYFGHFAISQSQAGSTCTAGQITITKHSFFHDVDTAYTGSIFITTDLGIGDWSVAVGSMTLDNGAAGDGAATYTFLPADNGEVTLFLEIDTLSTIDVNVTNTFIAEFEDPIFVFNDVITNVTYRDEFETASYANNDGSTFWGGDWVEDDGEGAGPATGNITISGGQLVFTSTVANPTPDLARTVDLSLYTVTETVFLNFDYSYQFLNAGSDVLIVEAKATSGDAFTTVHTFSGIGGTNLTPQPLSLDLTTLLGSPTWTDTTEIRFRISGGYTGTSTIFFDNIEVATGTTDCGIGTIEHYEIRVDGVTQTAVAPPLPGIACVGSLVTITGHDLSHFPSPSGEQVTLQTSTGKGDWTLFSGNGVLTNGTLGDGIATYDFAPGEVSVSFVFNYTDPAADPELVNFNLNSAFGVNIDEDPTVAIDQAGLLFYNEDAGMPVSMIPIPLQIAAKNSNIDVGVDILFTIEGVRTSDNDPLACSPLFDVGNVLSIGFAAECLDPGTCSGSLSDQFSINDIVMTPAGDNSGAGTLASFVEVDITMLDQGAGRVGGNIYFNYADAGQIQIHAGYEIPLGNNIAGTPSEDFLIGSSNAFVVRPFGFDIDFAGDREINGIGVDSTSFAADADGTVHAIAGVAFDATVTAIVWELADDLNFDGIPDEGAALYDNASTPNYGNESTAGNYDVLITHQLVAPGGGVAGTLDNGLFQNFTNGAQLQSMMFDEVGIVDLTAQLVNSADIMQPGNFMGTGVALSGNVTQVGRFIPNDFILTGGMITPRSLADDQTNCIAPSTFTYMGEQFGISVNITARNGEMVPQTTKNYVGDFAKLNGSDFTSDRFAAIEQIGGPDNDYSARIANPTTGADRSVTWGMDPMVDGGVGMLMGNLIFNRQISLAEEAPFSALTIGLNSTMVSTEYSGVLPTVTVPFVLDLDIDDTGPDDVSVLADGDFRYGRLLIDNSYGPETEPLDIPFRIQYFDGTDFVLNTDDSCTTLFFEQTSAPSALTFLTDGGSYTENLDDSETVIEVGFDIELGLFDGQTALRATDADQDVDRPLETSAPGIGNEGTVVIEFDLKHDSLPFWLDFLSYDWRVAGELEDDENNDLIYTDNPRSRLEFGSYRGHDRVINWQEIYIGPNP